MFSGFTCIFFLLAIFQFSLQKSRLTLTQSKNKTNKTPAARRHQLPADRQATRYLSDDSVEKAPDRSHGTCPARFLLKAVIRELTGWTCDAANGSTCGRDLASTGNLDREAHSKETPASGAQADPPPTPATGRRKKGLAWTLPETQSYLSWCLLHIMLKV